MKIEDIKGFSVSTNKELQDLFYKYGDLSIGWTGGDATYSVPLSNGSIVWLFSDTFVGPIRKGFRPDMPITKMINNCLVIQKEGKLKTIMSGNKETPKSFLYPEGDTWYWIGPGHYNGSNLEIIASEFRKKGTGIFAFEEVGLHLHEVDVGNFTTIRKTELPWIRGTSFYSWILPDGGFLYIYGVKDDSMVLARVHGKSLFSDFEFYSAGKWSKKIKDSSKILKNVSHSYSAMRYLDGYLILTIDTSKENPGLIRLYSGKHPYGPFDNFFDLFRTPELNDYPQDYGIITYNALLHPELSTLNNFVVTYNANGSGKLSLNDVSVYRPRFLNIKPCF
jgi:hypothetical protein